MLNCPAKVIHKYFLLKKKRDSYQQFFFDKVVTGYV